MVDDDVTVLQQGIGVVQDNNGIILGTGVFIGSDGSLLSCFRVSDDDPAPFLAQHVYRVACAGRIHAAKLVHSVVVFAHTHIAILRLISGTLPETVAILPLGNWRPIGMQDFITIGFSTNLQNNQHTITGSIDTTIQSTHMMLLQLSTTSQDEADRLAHMPGAPILSVALRRVVGMLLPPFEQPDENARPAYSYAVSIDAVARFWHPLRSRFKEQRLYDELLHILSPDGRFGRDRLQELCQERMPTFFGITWNELGDNKHQDLLDRLRTMRKLQSFVNWLQRTYPDDTRTLDSVLFYYNFVNRKEELNRIFHGGQYVVLDAPAGYGKTALLRELERSYTERHWLCVPIDVPAAPATCESVATSIQTFLERGGMVSHVAPADMGRIIGAQLVETWKKIYADTSLAEERRVQKSKVVVSIDNLHILPAEELDNLINHFIPAVYETYRKSEDADDFRIHFAGRHIGKLMQSRPHHFKVTSISLTPFKFDVIKETITQQTTDIPEQTARLWAAHIMQVTGGHPRCMYTLLSMLNFLQLPDTYFQTHQLEYQQLVWPMANEIRQAIPESLQAIFDTLSFFRSYNARLLDWLITNALIIWSGRDGSSLARRLTETHLVKRGHGGFLRDDIVRRMLNIRLRWEQPELFTHRWHTALSVYEHILSQTKHYPDVITVEALFSELQRAYYIYDPVQQTLSTLDGAGRANLAHHFFMSGGILERHLTSLSTLSDDPTSTDILASLKETLHHDWEFQFTINYYLRQDEFTEEPYHMLLDYIDTKITEK